MFSMQAGRYRSGCDDVIVVFIRSNSSHIWTAFQGEQQRLSFARLVLKGRTDKAFLDEATSALDTAGEARLYNLLPTLCNNFISVGHRETLVQHHTVLASKHHVDA